MKKLLENVFPFLFKERKKDSKKKRFDSLKPTRDEKEADLDSYFENKKKKK